jgi:autotransporter passenger strand-loop-strand repeat protein
VASNTVVSGGKQAVSSGGVAYDTVVSSGGSLYVSSGGTAISAGVLNGGKIVVVLRPGLFEDRRGMFVSRTSGTNF